MASKTRQVACLLLLLLSVFSLPGCFGSVDINELAMVMGVGIDEGKMPGTVLVTVQVARPADAVGQTGAPTPGTGEPVWSAQAEGRNIFDAIRNLGRFSSRRVYWAHNKVIIIGGDYARKEGINGVIDFFTRNHELRMRTWVMATRGQASELIASKTGLQVVPAESIERLFRYSGIVAEAPKVDMRLLQADYLSDSTEAILPVVDIEPRGISTENAGEETSTPQVELSGTAYFDRDKLNGWLSPEQSHALMWFREPPKSRVITFPSSIDGTPVSLEVKQQTFVVNPNFSRGQVSFQVSLHTVLDLVEIDSKSNLPHGAVMPKLETQASKLLDAELRGIIATAQQEKLDFLGVGKVFHDKYPVEWRRVKAHWGEKLAEAKFTVVVTSEIHNPVLLQEPTKPGKPQTSEVLG